MHAHACEYVHYLKMSSNFSSSYWPIRLSIVRGGTSKLDCQPITLFITFSLMCVAKAEMWHPTSPHPHPQQTHPDAQVRFFRSVGQHLNHPNTATWRPSHATIFMPAPFLLLPLAPPPISFSFPSFKQIQSNSKKKKHAGKIASLGCLPPPIKHTPFYRGQTKFRVHLLFTTLTKWLIHCV